MMSNEPYDEQAPVVRPSSPIRWLSWPVAVLGLILPFTIVITVSRENLAGSVLAYVNCLVIIWALLHFIKTDALLGVVLLAALPFLLTAWPVPSLFFALFHVPGWYTTLTARIPHLEGFTRVQGAVLVFLLGYLPPLMLFFHRTRGDRGAPLSSPTKLAHMVAVYCILVTGVYDFARVFLPDVAGSGIVWWTWGLYNYSVGLYLVLGALSPYLSHLLKLFLVPFFGAHLLIFAVGNARLPGLLPLIWWSVGYLFLSSVPAKRKMVLLSVLLAALPVYVMLGNTTRETLGTVGFKNFNRRFDVLVRGVGQRKVDVLNTSASTLARLFMTGGHCIITRTPEGLGYFKFNPVTYGQEMLESLIPGALYYRPIYRTNRHLIRYGFNIGPTSIEISLLGHFWMLGGWLAVFLGGIATALVHGAALEVVRRARRVSWTKALIYAAFLCSATFVCFGGDFIVAFRTVIWHTLMAFCVYQLIRIVVGESGEDSAYTEFEQQAYESEAWRELPGRS